MSYAENLNGTFRIKGVGYIGRFSTILYKGNNFNDFLLASLHINLLPM